MQTVETDVASSHIARLQSSIRIEYLSNDQVADCVTADSPTVAVEQLSDAFCDYLNADVLTEAKLVEQRLQADWAKSNREADRRRALARTGSHFRIHYHRQTDGDLKPTFDERISVMALIIFAFLALAGALINVLYAIKALNPVTYELPVWELALMATPILLASKLGLLATLAMPSPQSITRLCIGFSCAGAVALLVYLTSLSIEISLSDAGAAFSYGATTPSTWSFALPGIRLWSQIFAEISFSCAATAGVALFGLRGKTISVTPCEVYAALNSAALEQEAECASIAAQIEACRGIISTIESHKRFALQDGRGRVETLQKKINNAAETAKMSILNAQRSGRDPVQLRLV